MVVDLENCASIKSGVKTYPKTEKSWLQKVM